MPSPSKPHSLFFGTVRTVAAALLVFQIILITATVHYVMLPMAKRSADDLASLLILSAKTWVELPPDTRKDFELELIREHQFMLFEDIAPLAERNIPLPYLTLLDDALSARLGEPVSIKVTDLDTTWFWADIPAGGKLIRIGFPRSRLLTDPTTMLLLALFATVLLSLFTAYILARRITRPLAQFSQAAKRIGTGSLPADMPPSPVQEFSELAATFNQMALQVRELLANRTTLLAGISHDLRTPLSRMRLAVEMLPENSDQKTVERLRRDIEDMNMLIGEFLTLSRDLQQESAEQIDLAAMLREMTEEKNAQGAQVACHVQPGMTVRAGPLALHRVVQNLLGNALRYSDGKPVQIEAVRNDDAALIEILDRGPGIPKHEMEKVFRPFYRIESSRNTDTGGSGLGLAIVQQLCTANGWHVELLPREDGGTKATLRLPLSESQQEQP
ncbi:MAG: HAMP domain-containing protein [Gammaproteobacteria bacterium]|nr:HAMP domain-containing protein [Gammaproteobacteria bacterium]MBU1625670.1 HAMP domain-containing protein [Gammaproteobacteria bacterium]MBU1980930.1 HAMP domain-containing protein [Gammaproteobacteria bacterium]